MASRPQFTTDLRGGLAIIQNEFPGLSDIITQLLFALLTREHVLWYSGPGRAKTMLARRAFGLFPNARRFSTALTVETTAADLFGADIPNEYLEKGRIIFNLENGMVDSHFVYLDEFFDANEKVLRVLLTILHERMFERKDQQAQALLMTAIMTTNYVTMTPATEALLDRIVCKAVVPRITSLTDRMGMYDTYLGYDGPPPELPRLDIEELIELSGLIESADGIEVPAGVRLMHAVLMDIFTEARLRDRAGTEGVELPTDAVEPLAGLTPRSEVKLFDKTRAAAILDNRMTANYRDLMADRYGLITIGDGGHEDAIWAELCANSLPVNGREEECWQILGDLAELIRKIDTEAAFATPTVIRVGGGIEVKGRVEIMELMDKLARRRVNPLIRTCSDRLLTEFDDIARRQETKTLAARYDLQRGWV